MARFVIINRTSCNIHLVIPEPPGSRRHSAAILLPASMSVDILPYAGSIDNCKRIATLRDLQTKNIIDIIEEP